MKKLRLNAFTARGIRIPCQFFNGNIASPGARTVSSSMSLVIGAVLLVSTLVIPTSLHAEQASPEIVSQLDTLLSEKRYPELERELAVVQELSQSDRAFFAGVLANRNNRVAESIRLLEPETRTLLHGSSGRAEIALCTLADDYAKNFRYGEAADTYAMLSRLPGYTEDEKGCQAKIEAGRWELLRHAPPQTTSMTGPFMLDEHRTPAGFIEVPVEALNFSDRWILDTGANLSAVTRSVADKLGLELSKESSTAQGGNGIFVAIHTAVIPEIHLGAATVRNVAVMVFEDKDLTFPQFPYQIHGCIGFPVLESLGQITFHKNGRFGVQEPKTTSRDANRSRLYLERFTVLVDAQVAGEDQLLTLDTGATGTYLSQLYYKDHRQNFNGTSPLQLQLVGAGGSSLIHAYLLHGASLAVGGSCLLLDNVAVLTEPSGVPDEFSGNVGQNVLGEFRAYTIDFRSMTLTVEDPGEVSGGAAKRCPSNLKATASSPGGAISREVSMQLAPPWVNAK
jgi:Aspartyl protease